MGFEVIIVSSIAPVEQRVSYTRELSGGAPSEHPSRLPLPASLLRQQIILEPPGIDTSTLKKIGDEITEELEYTPGNLFVKQYIHPKYANPANGGILCAELPER